MATEIELQYGVTFGKCDSSDWFPFEWTIDGEAEKAYLHAMRYHLPLEDEPALASVIDEAAEEISETEAGNLVDCDDPYVMECMGMVPMDVDELNDLVHSRDAHALEYFDLEDASDEEIEEWDANDLYDIPNVCDFEEDFEAENPFEGGYVLNVEFSDHPEDEDLEEDEARTVLQELMKASPRDDAEIIHYIKEMEDFFSGDSLLDFALSLAGDLGMDDSFSKLISSGVTDDSDNSDKEEN